MAELFTCVDRWGRPIALTEEWWNGHILIGHLQLYGQHAALVAALTNPQAVTHDRHYSNGENFYALGVLTPPLDQLYLKVCVRFTAMGPGAPAYGAVLTAYPISEVQRTEVQRWP